MIIKNFGLDGLGRRLRYPESARICFLVSPTFGFWMAVAEVVSAQLLQRVGTAPARRCDLCGPVSRCAGDGEAMAVVMMVIAARCGGRDWRLCGSTLSYKRLQFATELLFCSQ
ncbi:hypothetical protein J6590_059821 [Homalodisca vitripennis]|nr:hypothetical protein J6590_059821 [Homalodisca vitripennis]